MFYRKKEIQGKNKSIQLIRKTKIYKKLITTNTNKK